MAGYNNKTGGAMVVGDVTGAGTRMGVGVKEQVCKADMGHWWETVLGVLGLFPFYFWFGLYSVHQVAMAIMLVPVTARWFEDRRVCRMGGYLPLLCRVEGPHGVFAFLRFGANGIFLVIGTLGMCLKVMDWERRLPVLGRSSVSVQQNVVLWVLIHYFLPMWLRDVLLPWDVLLGLLVVSKRGDVAAVTFLASMVVLVSRITGVSTIILWYLCGELGRRFVAQVEVNADVMVGEELDERLVPLFGSCSVRADINKEIASVLGATTQDGVLWPRVRMYAYCGDKLAYCRGGYVGLAAGFTVDKMQRANRIFDDVVLREAMRTKAAKWWREQDDSMRGKPAATVLEACFFLVMRAMETERQREEVVRVYMSVLRRIADINVGKIEGEVFVECEE